jgi:hypothetical protein
MPKTGLSKLSAPQLRARLASARSVQRTAIGIYALILVVWVLSGSWRANLPVFVVALVMGGAVAVVVSTTPARIRAELERREAD